MKFFFSFLFYYFIFFLCILHDKPNRKIRNSFSLFLFLSFFFLFNYFVLSMILTEPKEGQRKLLSVNSDATATSFSEAFHMAPANNPMDNMAASLRPKTGLQPMPPLTSAEKYHQNKKKLNLILIYFLKKMKIYKFTHCSNLNRNISLTDRIGRPRQFLRRTTIATRYFHVPSLKNENKSDQFYYRNSKFFKK